MLFRASTFLFVAATLLCAAGSMAVADNAVPDTLTNTMIETRQRLMVQMIRATKIPRAMVKGETPLDATAVKEAVKRVLEATSALPRLFPDDSSAGSAALPTLFENRADFEARLIGLEQTALAMALAAQRGPKELAFAFGEYQAVCDGCHTKYRKPEREEK